MPPIVHEVLCSALIINLRGSKALGNVLLEVGETDLPEQRVVNVSQIFTAYQALLTEKLAVCQNSVFSKFSQVGHGYRTGSYRLIRSRLHMTQGRSPADCECRVCRVSERSLLQIHSSDRVELFKKPPILSLMQRFLKF